MIADQINKGETMADIGTDHGFLPLYLMENGISPYVIMTDISNGSLNKAKENFNLYYGQDSKWTYENKEQWIYDFRRGDGISIIENAEVDDIVIAGIGGKLIINILEKDLKKTKSFKKIILQPRNGQAKLRYWLIQNDFSIVCEKLVWEGKFICEIFVAKLEKSQEVSINREKIKNNNLEKKMLDRATVEEITYEVPEKVFYHNGSIAKEFVELRMKKEEHILKGILAAEILDEKKYENIILRIDYLKKLLSKYN